MATAITWPFARPWLRDGYGFARADVHARLQTRLGTAQLRIGTTGPSTFTASLSMSGEEVDQFIDWEFWTLGASRNFFNAPVKSGSQVMTREVRMVDRTEPVQLQGANRFRITATFETRVGTERSLIEYAGMFNEDDTIIG